MERVLIPVLIMTGAGVLVALAVPVAFLMISGGYFARRTAIRVGPAAARYAGDLTERAMDLRGRVTPARLQRTLTIAAVGCTLALPSLAIPVADLASDVSSAHSFVALTPTPGQQATPLRSCCAVSTPSPAVPQQLRATPVITGDGGGDALPSSPASICPSSCARFRRQGTHQLSPGGKSNKTKKKPKRSS